MLFSHSLEMHLMFFSLSEWDIQMLEEQFAKQADKSPEIVWLLHGCFLYIS